jgi:hypothetical protein
MNCPDIDFVVTPCIRRIKYTPIIYHYNIEEETSKHSLIGYCKKHLHQYDKIEYDLNFFIL